mmetsp:Transcript_28152/g.94825  ORF Transcript_28152/g.94825 Transcript_28152/m.94825 type:complete len:305 (+) Transcript_28152:381-1295(+)
MSSPVFNVHGARPAQEQLELVRVEDRQGFRGHDGVQAPRNVPHRVPSRLVGVVPPQRGHVVQLALAVHADVSAARSQLAHDQRLAIALRRLAVGGPRLLPHDSEVERAHVARALGVEERARRAGRGQVRCGDCDRKVEVQVFNRVVVHEPLDVAEEIGVHKLQVRKLQRRAEEELVDWQRQGHVQRHVLQQSFANQPASKLVEVSRARVAAQRLRQRRRRLWHELAAGGRAEDAHVALENRSSRQLEPLPLQAADVDARLVDELDAHPLPQRRRLEAQHLLQRVLQEAPAPHLEPDVALRRRRA